MGLSPWSISQYLQCEFREGSLKQRKALGEDFKSMAAGLVPEGKTDAELYFIMQHYKMPTRLLDWTTNPLVSLLFAVSDYPEKNGVLFAIDVCNVKTERGVSHLWA